MKNIKPSLSRLVRVKYVQSWLMHYGISISSGEVQVMDYAEVYQTMCESLDDCTEVVNLRFLRLKSGYYLVCVQRVAAVKTLGGQPYGDR